MEVTQILTIEILLNWSESFDGTGVPEETKSIGGRNLKFPPDSLVNVKYFQALHNWFDLVLYWLIKC